MPPPYGLTGTVLLLTWLGARGESFSEWAVCPHVQWLCNLPCLHQVWNQWGITQGYNNLQGKYLWQKFRSQKTVPLRRLENGWEKLHGIPFSGAETGAWVMPCAEHAKIIELPCSLFLWVQWNIGLLIDLSSVEEEVNLSLLHPSQSRIAWTVVSRHLSGNEGSIPISIQVPRLRNPVGWKVEKVAYRGTIAKRETNVSVHLSPVLRVN